MNLITPDGGLLFWMVIIFGLLLFLLVKFGFPIITSSVEKRSARIGKSLEDARRIEEEMEELSLTRRQMLDDTRKEQAAIIREASDTGKKIVADARQKAQAEADRILADARAQIAAEKEFAIRDIRKEVGLLSVDIAERIIRHDLSQDKAQQALIDNLVDEVSGKQLPSS